MPKAEAGPLYGAIFPILISVSVTPGAYFLSADAGVQQAMATTQAALSANDSQRKTAFDRGSQANPPILTQSDGGQLWANGPL